MKVVGSVLLALASATASPAQQGAERLDPLRPPKGHEAAAESVEFRLDADGRVMIFPAPSHGMLDLPPDPVIRNLDYALGNVGLIGLLSLLGAGDTDMASASGAEDFFARLGLTDADAILKGRLEPLTAGAETTTRLQQLLAVRVAGLRDLRDSRAAIERLREAELAKGETGDTLLLDAIADTLRRFDRKPVEIRELPELDLTAAFANAPADSNLFLRIDNYRLPPTGLGSISEHLGLELTRNMILEAGGKLTPAAWAGGRSLAAVAPILAYELPRRIGNFRIDRSLIAAKLDPQRPDSASLWIRMEGLYAAPALRRLLEEEGFTPTTDDSTVLSLQADPRVQARLGNGFVEYFDRGAHEKAFLKIGRFPFANLATRFPALSDPAPIAFARPRIRRSADDPLAELPESLTIQVARNNPHFLRVALGVRDDEAARRLAQELQRSRDQLTESHPVELSAIQIRAEEHRVKIAGDFRSLWTDALVPILADLLD